ncbi:MAG TPA: MFS transporter, partial [Candidatus Limnocylindrales bacterium]
MARPPLPAFIADVVDDRQARATLLAGAAALFAAGLDPKVWGPSLTTVQSAIRARPELESYVLIGAVGFAIMLLIGGAIGDLRQARPLILGGLVVLVATDVIGLVVTSGPAFIAVRLVGSAASALVVPASLACVALAYRGVARATAIGFAYAAYGGAQALMPMLLTLIPGERWPGFVVAALAAALALAIARNRVPQLERPGRQERPYVLGTALWASSIVAISAGLLWLGSGWDNPVRLAIVGLGVALLVAFFVAEARRRAEHPASLRVDRRPVTIALFAGVVIAIAQSVPMVLLPTYFAIVPRYGPLFGLAAVAPLFLGL